MANLVVCCDGTWNNPSQEDNGIPAPTNVVKLYHSLKTDYADKQKAFYHPGLGGEETGIFNSVVDGALGKSIKRHICSAYFWIANNYEHGDKIFLFGFSRGAFTARSLSGLLGLGLLDFKGVDNKTKWEQTHSLFETYRSKSPDTPPGKFLNNRAPQGIHFIGVWDTVGALGIPNDMEFFNLLDNPAKWRFHDTSIGSHIKHARHAMAMDEKRSSFSVTRWKNATSHPDVIEKWFSGAHSDVGGGYANNDLSDIALEWMLKESINKGLKIRENVFEQLAPNPLGVLHNSYKGVFAKFRSRPRNVECMNSYPGNFHESVHTRSSVSPITHPSYWPCKRLDVGESFEFDVFAKMTWNPSYIYMEKGEKYYFSAEGEWQDSKDICDWKGTEDGNLTAGDIIRTVSSLWGYTERKFKQLTDNRSTDFWGTKRVERMRWFIAVGCISNDSGNGEAVDNDGSPCPHQYYALPNHNSVSTAIEIDSPGYFYAFANDVWALYDNNHGSIKLSINRIE